MSLTQHSEYFQESQIENEHTKSHSQHKSDSSKNNVNVHGDMSSIFSQDHNCMTALCTHGKSTASISTTINDVDQLEQATTLQDASELELCRIITDDERNNTHDYASSIDESMESDIAWTEVYDKCCVHSQFEWLIIVISVCGIAVVLYFFLLALELISESARVMSGCKTGELFGNNTNPVAALMVGLLATVLVQSSSTTTSVIVSLVGNGVTVKQGIYMVMGANIGTTITSTVVALVQAGDGEMLERAFAGASLHDVFNILTVTVLLPIELLTGYMTALTRLCVRHANVKSNGNWQGPIKKYVAPLGDRFIKSNDALIEGIARGDGSCANGGGYYPVVCTGPPSEATCKGGLISCDTITGKCPFFFSVNATAADDQVAGGVTFAITFIVLLFCLFGLIYILQTLMLKLSRRVFHKITNVNGYFAIVVGLGLTAFIHSSAVVTSMLVPLAGVGVLKLEQVFPITLGANVGTTLTAVMAALVADDSQALRVALAHVFFNVTGVLIWYPIPFMRRIPMGFARRLGKLTRIWRGFAVVYIIVTFFITPLIFIGISAAFQKHSKGYTVLGAFICIVITTGVIYIICWCKLRGGKIKCLNYMKSRERKRLALKNLPDNLEYLHTAVSGLANHTGFTFETESNKSSHERLSLMDEDELEAKQFLIEFACSEEQSGDMASTGHYPT